MAGKKKPNATNEKLGIVVASEKGDNVEIFYHEPKTARRRTGSIFNTRMTSSREMRDRSMELVESVVEAGKLHEHPEFGAWLTKLGRMRSR